MFPRYENILYHTLSPSSQSSHYVCWIYTSLAYQLDGYLSIIKLSLRPSTKIFTHNSKPDIFTFCTSSGFGGKSAAHVHDPAFCEYSNQQVGLSTSIQLQVFTLFRKVSRTYSSITISSICGHVCIGLQG